MILKKIFFPTIFILLTYGFWLSPHFKELATGIAVFIFGILSLQKAFKAGFNLNEFTALRPKSILNFYRIGIFITVVMQFSHAITENILVTLN